MENYSDHKKNKIINGNDRYIQNLGVYIFEYLIIFLNFNNLYISNFVMINIFPDLTIS